MEIARQMIYKNEIKISVIMSLYNCAPYLSESINSIINQTITEWELIVCDDGSTDDTYLIAKRYKQLYPEKIRLMRLRRNCKQAIARNKCIERARGKYIVIMDGDDTCDPERLQKEYDFLEINPEFDFVGTGMRFVDEHGIWGISLPKKYPSKTDFMKSSPFCAPTCMFRKRVIDAVGGYQEGKKYWRVEDVDLFVRLYANGYFGANIPEPLYNYREYKETIARRNFRTRIHRAKYAIEIVQVLKLPKKNVIYGLRALAIGLLPRNVYMMLHRWKYSRLFKI